MKCFVRNPIDRSEVGDEVCSTLYNETIFHLVRDNFAIFCPIQEDIAVILYSL